MLITFLEVMLLVALVCLSISNITQKVIEGMQKAMWIEKQKECKEKFYAAVWDGKKNAQILVVIHITMLIVQLEMWPLLNKLWVHFYEIFRIALQWYKQQLSKIWGDLNHHTDHPNRKIGKYGGNELRALRSPSALVDVRQQMPGYKTELGLVTWQPIIILVQSHLLEEMVAMQNTRQQLYTKITTWLYNPKDTPITTGWQRSMKLV